MEEQLESMLGFDLVTEGDKHLGWLLTLASSSREDRETNRVYSCIDLYFVCQDGSMFKAKYKFRPHFYAATKDKMEMDVEAYLRRCYECQIADIEIVEKEDLKSCLHKRYLKVSFDTVQQLMQVKNDLVHAVERNKAKLEAEDAYESILSGKSKQRPQDFIDYINDLREFDVPYHVRFAIDKGFVHCQMIEHPERLHEKYNYDGIQARPEDRSTDECLEASMGSMSADIQIDIISNWTIAENLTKATQDHFILIVSEFLYFPWKFTQEEAVKRASAMGDLSLYSINHSLNRRNS